MKLAILFFFHEDIEVCENRLKILRKDNPNMSIFGLFGGEIARAGEFSSALDSYLDDFYCFEKTDDPHWKWFNCELMVNEWFKDRGRDLSWDTISVMAWDVLVFGPHEEVFSDLKKDEMLLSGLRPVKEVYDWWYWTRPDNEPENKRYHSFVEYLKENHGYEQDLLCCQPLVFCLPRCFLEKYVQLPSPEEGYMEYRMPTFAKIFGIPFCNADKFSIWWKDEPGAKDIPVEKRLRHAQKDQIPLRVIMRNLKDKNESRVFHPVRRIYPIDIKSFFAAARDKVLNKRYE